MSLDLFLSQLFAQGRLRVGVEDTSTADWRAVDEQLMACERARREDLPGNPPPVSMAAARHGAVLMYRACQLLVYRDVDAGSVQRQLTAPLTGCRLSPSVHYSVDLGLSYLPDAVGLARRASPADPLVEALRRLATCWPLSGVGVPDADLGDLKHIVADPCLLQLYVDRMFARQDYRGLAHQQVRESARRAIGPFTELAPEAARRLGLGGDDRDEVGAAEEGPV